MAYEKPLDPDDWYDEEYGDWLDRDFETEAEAVSFFEGAAEILAADGVPCVIGVFFEEPRTEVWPDKRNPWL